MGTIKFDVAVSVNVNLSQDAKDFITALFANRQTGCVHHEKVIEEPKTEQVAEEQNRSVEPEKEVIVQKHETVSEKSVSIEEIRAILAMKVNDHREAIKQKLNELGAPSVTKLDPTKFTEMYNFLSSL